MEVRPGLEGARHRGAVTGPGEVAADDDVDARARGRHGSALACAAAGPMTRRRRLQRFAVAAVLAACVVLGLRQLSLSLLLRGGLMGPVLQQWAAGGVDTGGSIKSHILLDGPAWRGARRLASVAAAAPGAAQQRQQQQGPCPHTTAGARVSAPYV
jgi:hypothetical protein